MEILLDVIVAGVVAGGVAGGIVLMGRTRTPRHAAGGVAAVSLPGGALAPEWSDAEGRDGEAGGGGAQLAVAADPATRAALRDEIDVELRERRAEIARTEERLITKEEALGVRLEEFA